MEHEYAITILRLLYAVVAGGLIGIERSLHGRAAGFRTHTLVCAASALLMLLTIFQWSLIEAAPLQTVRTDPTRMAQGIMTGIGFLGAGVIIQERLSVRGLTTAASIWMTAALGIIIGMGLYFAALMGVVLTLGALVGMRWIEDRVPNLAYARLTVRFPTERAMDEHALREVIGAVGVHSSQFSYHLTDEGRTVEYRMTLRSRERDGFRRLAQELRSVEGVSEYSLVPTGG
ncbi:MAG: MgtC/SapB family protein [Gammaproteobacteria bacterium]|nr:MgtC/SapB family protein [Gammaproteobacteria bacterium]NIR60613.1 MgtC/SapB family protein [Gammaproteobacteria bacterium]